MSFTSSSTTTQSLLQEPHGPVATPTDSLVHFPNIYGRHVIVDMDANNRLQIQRWREQSGNPEATFGFSLCRQGFGRVVDNLPTREDAEQLAIRLNTGIAGLDAQAVKTRTWAIMAVSSVGTLV